MIKIKPVVPEKNVKHEQNLETLQLAAKCLGINKNQCLIKIRPVVPEKNKKIEENLETWKPKHKQKSKFDQDQTSSSWEKCKKLRNF